MKSSKMKKVSYQHCSWLWRQKCVYVWLKHNKQQYWWGGRHSTISTIVPFVWKCHHHQDKQGIQPSVSASIFITFFHLICSLLDHSWKLAGMKFIIVIFFSSPLDPGQQHNHIIQCTDIDFCCCFWPIFSHHQQHPSCAYFPFSSCSTYWLTEY